MGREELKGKIGARMGVLSRKQEEGGQGQKKNKKKNPEKERELGGCPSV